MGVQYLGNQKIISYLGRQKVQLAMPGNFEPSKIEIWRQDELAPAMEMIPNEVGTTISYSSKIYSAFDVELEGLPTQWRMTESNPAVQVGQKSGVVSITEKALSGTTYTLTAEIAIDKFKHISASVILVVDYNGAEVEDINRDEFTVLTTSVRFIPFGGRSSCVIHWGDGTSYKHNCVSNIHAKKYPHQGPWVIQFVNFVGPGTFRLEWD